jgi:predicted lipopolysaccharide heptosyltransferase III
MRQPLNPREKPRIDLSDLKKILLIRLRRIGDVVMTTPAVAVLKAQLPHASISYLIEEPYRELVEGNPHLDEVFIVPRKQNTRDFLRLTQTIRKKRFDCLIDFHGGPRASWITLLSGAELKVGYRIRYKGFLYDIRVPRSREKEHIHSVENHVNLIRALGIEVNTVPPLFLPGADEGEKEKIAGLLRNCGQEKIKIAVLHVGAGNEFRDWGAENLIRLADMITRQSNACVLLAGGPEDIRRAETIAKQGQAPVFSLAGQIGLRELRELIDRADLFIGTDSGPMHIAASTDTPIVALFGPTIPAHFRPWRENTLLIEKDFDCRSSCRQRECTYGDFRCLQSITPEEVYTACVEFL